MCGIAGFVGDGDSAVLNKMLTKIAHRGPDDQNVDIDRGRRVFLGHTRLAILDIEGGRQPMSDAGGHINIVFNGEIYNHAELRRELESIGLIFQSDHSDTEVLVNGYLHWGADLFPRLNGMFAFAIYDRRKGEMILARDRFGEKPLYYSKHANLLVFASEINALLQHPALDTEIDMLSVQKYFSYGFIPAPRTPYKKIEKLQGGRWLKYDIASGRCSENCFYRFRIEPDRTLEKRSLSSTAEEFESILQTTIQRRLQADVPVGLLLSGGIDSTAVLALSSQLGPAAKKKTFTIGFHEKSYDESGFARQAADLFGAENEVRLLTQNDMLKDLPDLLARMGEPICDPSILPTYKACAFAREQVKVVLTGDGGDEMLAGYDPFRALTPAKIYSALIPSKLHRGFRRLAELLPKSSRNMSLDFKVRRTLQGLSYPSNIWNPIWMAPLEPALIEEAFNTPVETDVLYSEATEVWDNADKDLTLLERSLEYFTRFYLQEQILTKTDRASMFCSLESRSVFLDNDVTEFCRVLPTRFKYHNGKGKIILRSLVDKFAGKALSQRPKKGFGFPISEWLKHSDQTNQISPKLGINNDFWERSWSSHKMGKADHRLFLFSALALDAALANH
ncbi:MAG: asparagine synthase (glutamine-hydrolyzing) [Alphaproteobacteria bacterium]